VLSPSEVLIEVGFAYVYAHRGRVCVRVFIGVSVRACCERLRCTVSFKKTNLITSTLDMVSLLLLIAVYTNPKRKREKKR
jgi:hypothetical protein